LSASYIRNEKDDVTNTHAGFNHVTTVERFEDYVRNTRENIDP